MRDRITNLLLYIWYFFIGGIFRFYPIDNNKIVFESYFGKGFGDNAKYIAKEMHETTNSNKVRMIWLLRKGTKADLPDYIEPVYRGTLGELFHLATAKVWVDNSRKHFGIKKRKNQYYIQAWHGCVPLKRIEGDAKDKLKKNYIRSAKKDSKNTDLMISNSGICTEMYRRAFWYNGEVLECGTPRMDIVFNINEEQKKEIRKRINLPEDVKIVLYAPTFRANNDDSVYEIDYVLLNKVLNEKFQTKWCILNRFHPNIRNKKLSKEVSNVYDVTDYPDMYELLSIADVLVTDYSSTMFEMSYADKPVFLFALDIEEYSDERGYYFDFSELPFPIATSNDELIKNILEYDYNIYLKKLEYFKRKINVIEEGKAAKAVADVIFNIMNK